MASSFPLSRRSLLKSGAGAIAAAMLPRAGAAAEFEYKMGHSSPESHPFHRRLLEAPTASARSRTGG
jgi:hypothetical protein